MPISLPGMPIGDRGHVVHELSADVTSAVTTQLVNWDRNADILFRARGQLTGLFRKVNGALDETEAECNETMPMKYIKVKEAPIQSH